MEPVALLPILPIRGVRLTFTLTAPTRLRFFHQPLVAALVRHLMDGALADEPRLWLEAPESGRVPFPQGDSYHFHLWACRGGETLLETLVERLRQLPAGVPAAARGLALGANLRFVSAADALSGERYEGVARLLPYDAAALARELDFYLEHPPTTLRLLAPARLLRPKQAGRPTKGEGRYVHDRGELVGDLLGQRIDDTLGTLLTAVGAAAPPRGAARFMVTEDDIGWFDTAYYDADGDANPMGGIIGQVQLELSDPAALPALVLGQYTGIGQRRTFGWGRYRLETASGAGTRPARCPSRGVLARAADAANVELAYRCIRANADGRTAPDLDPLDDNLTALAWSEHSGPVDDLLAEVTERLRAAALTPAAGIDGEVLSRPQAAPTGPRGPRAEPLRGWILQREGKAPRPLAVPPFAERIAQRAVLQILRTDFDPLLSAASYGYRRGISRQDARDRLQALYREGYEWVYEADIDDFFDSVSHARLETRLRSLLPDDPVVDQLMAWVAAPVSFRGERIERPAGLPQGAPLSPLLANLILDDFDADLEVMGFRLVRFADDFVIACRSLEEAQAAAARVRQSLAEIDLSLNEDKSRVTHFDRGFRFLAACRT
ncbi:reverse transcriptase domain-containing protein [uncultured Thiodictyon sp.]|uniref:reverse transcriptase domain-containing protein n=1 Tax=uncultured Thiodictyon sp. TaxID=1846217 RepID=UPI0025F4BD5B|nr:reverse transcriptase domain-containing protein [uncultured Thiodictyon sp.]